MYPPGTKLEPGCVVDEVRGGAGEAVLILRCGRDPRAYGIPIPLGDTRREFYYTENPVASVDEWLESVRIGMSIHVGTGLHARARRTLVGDYIELREADGWQYDDRFYLDVVDPDEPQSWDRIQLVVAAGLDPGPAIASRDEGRLLCWVTAFEEDSQANPYAGHAVVSWSGEDSADLEHVEVRPGAPVTVLVGLATCVTIGLDAPELDLVGFRYAADGRRVVDTSFLDEDPAGAAALLRDVLTAAAEPSKPHGAGAGRRQDTTSGHWWTRSRRGPAQAPATGDAG
jgi:hypothetical protein